MPLRRLPSAIADVDAIWAYVRLHDADAADRLVTAFTAAAARLEDFPHSGAPRGDVAPSARGIVVGSYLILHRVTGDWVEIVRVVHTARDLRSFATDFPTED